MPPKKSIENRSYSEEDKKVTKVSEQSARRRSFLYTEKLSAAASDSSTNLTHIEATTSRLEREAHDLRVNEPRLSYGIKHISPKILSDIQSWVHKMPQEPGDQLHQLQDASCTIEEYKKLDQQSQIDITRKTKALRAYRNIETLTSDLLTNDVTLYNVESLRNLLKEVQKHSESFKPDNTDNISQETLKLNLEHIHQENEKLKQEDDSSYTTVAALDSIYKEDLPRLDYSIEHISSKVLSDAKDWAHRAFKKSGDQFHQLHDALSAIDDYKGLINQQSQIDNNRRLMAAKAYRNTEILTSELIIDDLTLYHTEPFRKLLDQHQKIHKDFLSENEELKNINASLDKLSRDNYKAASYRATALFDAAFYKTSGRNENVVKAKEKLNNGFSDLLEQYDSQKRSKKKVVQAIRDIDSIINQIGTDSTPIWRVVNFFRTDSVLKQYLVSEGQQDGNS